MPSGEELGTVLPQPLNSDVSSVLSTLGGQVSLQKPKDLFTFSKPHGLGTHELFKCLHKYLNPEKKNILALKCEQKKSNIKINICLIKYLQMQYYVKWSWASHIILI